MNVLKDGVEHINVYSKGKTDLGRFLSNFFPINFTIDGFDFKSIESWWYYTKMININNQSLLPIFSEYALDNIKSLVGFEAKNYFRKQQGLENVITDPSKEELKKVYLIKINKSDFFKERLLKNNLPLVHYYTFGDKIIQPKEYQWTVDLWEEIKKEL